MSDLFATLVASRKGAQPPPRSVNLWLLILLLVLVLSAAIRFVGPDPSGSASPDPLASESPTVRQSRTYTVTYKSGVFSPTNLRIHSGDTVIFRNDDTRPLRIVGQTDAASGKPIFDSARSIVNGDSYAFTFSSAGLFTYHNDDDAQEAGVIIVRAL